MRSALAEQFLPERITRSDKWVELAPHAILYDTPIIAKTNNGNAPITSYAAARTGEKLRVEEKCALETVC